ncbi:class I adenylate-forming enzyme family protein [Streptomyces pharetrae]|uniref:class I adenylate-forming enzyme family protein n=1 Tax=Streptomyces pharetrae TaxID=291370 RepID=UPI003347089E
MTYRDQAATSLLHHLIDEAARRWPQRTAVSTNDESLTHGEVAAASLRAAEWLRGLGVRRGDRVMMVGPSTVRVPVLLYAASRVGAPFSLLHQQTRGRALIHVLDDAEPTLLVADSQEALALAAERGIRAVHVDQADEHLSPPSAAPLPPEEDVPALFGPPLPVDPMCLIYTSGTTSAPKAVVSTHQQALFAVRAIRTALDYRLEDIVYCPLPLSFDYGMYQLFLGALSGARVHLGLPTEVGPTLLRNLVGCGATVLAAVPAVAATLARLLRRSPEVTPRLRLLTNTGAAMPAETLAELRAAVPGMRVQLMFGLTECKRAAIMPPDGDLAHPGACGRALPGTEVFAVDAKGDRLPPGEVGELVVRGPNVMAGYWRRPELTAQRFPLRDGLFPQLCTGDHGWLDEEGYIHFVGRLDDLYKERGFRVSATEVEAAARRVAGVEQAAVLPPAGSRPALLAVVGEVVPQDVLTAMREEIEEFKIPRRCVVLEELPLTRNGKVDRDLLLAEVTRV